MVSDTLLLYFGGGTLLFFFWVYGIVSFAIDIRKKIIPRIRQYRRGRRRIANEKQEEREREKDERQLY